MIRKRRNFLKWQLGAGKRGTLRRAASDAGNGFETFGAAVAMVDYARTASHWIDNPEGIFTTTIDDIATDYTVPVERVREVLSALNRRRFIGVAGGVDIEACGEEDELRLRVSNYLDFNDPQGSDADRQAAKRYRDEMQNVQAFVTGCHGESHDITRREEKREEEITPMSTSDKPNLDNPAETVPTWRGIKHPGNDIADLFDHWVVATSRRSSVKPIKPRLSKIRARLKSYDVDTLKQVIDHYAADPFHSGQNDTNTRYDDLVTIFRDDAKIERALETPSKPAASSMQVNAIEAAWERTA